MFGLVCARPCKMIPDIRAEGCTPSPRASDLKVDHAKTWIDEEAQDFVDMERV